MRPNRALLSDFNGADLTYWTLVIVVIMAFVMIVGTLVKRELDRQEREQQAENHKQQADHFFNKIEEYRNDFQ